MWTERKKKTKRQVYGPEIDERIRDRITEIDKTRVPDHDLVRWNLLTTGRVTKQQHNRIPIEMIDDPEYKKFVEQVYEEERAKPGDALANYENLKTDSPRSSEKKAKGKEEKERKKIKGN